MNERDPGASPFKIMLKRVPLLGPALTEINRRTRTALFPGSTSYWKERYRNQGTSGPGSYGDLAAFKAAILNNFVRSHDIIRVLEFGCGDGNQLSLGDYESYIGLDVSPHAIAVCTERFAGDTTKSFFLYDPFSFCDPLRVFRADLVMSLDVIFHLVEDAAYERYLDQVFGSSDRFVIIYSSNQEGRPAPHVRHRRFTDWIDHFQPNWKLVEVIPNAHPYNPALQECTSSSDFYIYKSR